MAVELVKALSKAFNDGNILPTGNFFNTNSRNDDAELVNSLPLPPSYPQQQGPNDLE
jgi:hypothetical protein